MSKYTALTAIGCVIFAGAFVLNNFMQESIPEIVTWVACPLGGIITIAGLYFRNKEGK